MPSTITPIEKTRGYAVRPAQGLRFGNFERVVHLPPVKPQSGVGPHSFSTLNNRQIYRTVTDWLQSWQPWQQKILLYSIVNRCTLPQLEILGTTLEPLRHRDPLAASRHPLPLLPITPGTKSSTSLQSSPPKPSSVTTPQHSPVKISRGSDKNRLKTAERCTPQDSSASQESEKSTSKTSDSKEEEESGKTMRNLNVDQYASVVSSAVMMAALGEMAMADKLGNIMKTEMNTELIKPGSKESATKDHVAGNVETVSSNNSENPSSAETKDHVTAKADIVSNGSEQSAGTEDVEILENQRPQSQARPGILRSSSGKRADRSRNASAQFLGGQISFTPQSRQSQRSEGQRSESSRYRHSAFASSHARTPDFFRGKISVLGPMRRTVRSGRVQRPVGLGCLPVPLQQFYKNRSWWSSDLPGNIQLHSAHQPELLSSFREQLATIYEWLGQWEGHERLSLLKEVLKECGGDVLEALVIYLHQKLRDACDINRLPDRLLGYVLSHLPPKDILNAAQVCRRWRYLCATDDLWIVKCLELGEEEGIAHMPQLIEGANTKGMGVDWMLAYMELHSLVTAFRKNADALPHCSHAADFSFS
ncbi:hypothetical protein ACOMHN_009031 [Nucella lapillus]